jgi:type II secretory pathway component PulK
MTKGRNPYRSGTASYARFRKAALKRKSALAQATAARSKRPETGWRAKQRATAAQRALRAIETREEFRSNLNESDRAAFGRKSITQQQRLLKIQREYPESVPKDLPDPFVD